MRIQLPLIITIFSLFFSVNTFAQCIGGNHLMTTEGETVVSFCANQDEDQSIIVDPGKIGTPFAYILTDEDGIILRITNRPLFDFSGMEEGTYLIYGISYAGTLNRRAKGEHIFSARLASICFEFAANEVRIVKSSADGGEISLSDGSTEASVCSQDGTPDLLSFQTSSSDSPYVYLVTDEEGDIIDIVDETHDFEMAGPDHVLVIGLSYSGMLLASAGDNVYEDELADGCFSLSDNVIDVFRISVDGAMVQTIEGKTRVYTCVSDGNPDSLFFQNNSSSPADYIYIITTQNNVVLGTTEDGADFEAPIPGTSYVYGLSYAGDLLLMTGDTVGVNQAVDGCFDYSDNRVEVIKDVPNGGSVSSIDGEEIIYTCADDGKADVYLFQSSNSSNSQYAFAFTDEDGVVLDILGGNNINFEDYPPGTGYIYGIAYTGDFLLEPGDTIQQAILSSDCYDLSDNAVEVIRSIPDAGTLSFDDGSVELSICKGDGLSDSAIIIVDDASQNPYLFVFTDSAGFILDTIVSDTIDFETSPDGTARLYGVSYTGSIQFDAGVHIDSTDFSEDCYDVSSQYLEIDPLDIDAGLVKSEFGDSSVYICSEDTSLDRVALFNTSGTGYQYVYVFTDGSVIQAIMLNDTLLLDSIDEGEFTMRGLAYTGDLSIQTGDTLPQTPATSCFAWSANEVTIRYGEPYVGTITSGSGAYSIELCSNDTLNPGDQVVYLNRSGGSPTEFIWVLTGSGGQVLGLVNLDSISFETAPPGEYTIYGVTGSPLPDFNLGLQFEAEELDQEICLDVSDTSITVVKTEIAGGMIDFEAGGNIQYFCPGDTLVDIVGLDRMSEIGDEYAFLCIDSDGEIVAMSQNDSLNVSSLSEGEYSVVGVAYDGMWLAELGDTLGTDLLSTRCHARSVNRLRLIGIIPEGGMVQTSEGETEVDVIVGDGIPDPYILEAINASPSDYVFVVTDSSDKVLAILPDSTVDFEMVPPGENRVYGVAYTGNLLLDGGEEIMTSMISDDCYDLSDNAVVFHLMPDTSGLQGEPAVVDKPFEMQFFTEGGAKMLQLIQDGDQPLDGTIRVFDRSGRQLFHRQIESEDGSRMYRLNPEHGGIELYFIQVILEDGRHWTEKVMLLAD